MVCHAGEGRDASELPMRKWFDGNGWFWRGLKEGFYLRLVQVLYSHDVMESVGGEGGREGGSAERTIQSRKHKIIRIQTNLTH